MSEKWNASYMLPPGSDYVNRITGAEWNPSKNSGNPMITLNLELTNPQEVEIGDKQINIAGIKTTVYQTTTVMKNGIVDEEKTSKTRERAEKLLLSLGMKKEEIDWDNLNVDGLKGKLVFAFMEAETVERRANPTSEELKKNPKAVGKVLKNPLTGKPLVDYWPKTREIFGLHPNQDGVQVPY